MRAVKHSDSPQVDQEEQSKDVPRGRRQVPIETSTQQQLSQFFRLVSNCRRFLFGRGANGESTPSAAACPKVKHGFKQSIS